MNEEQKYVFLAVAVSPEYKRCVKVIAAEKGVTVSELLRKSIEEYLGEELQERLDRTTNE